MSPENRDHLHHARNQAATLLANVEYLREVFAHADPKRPLLSEADEETRSSALTSLASIDRALAGLVQALRALD